MNIAALPIATILSVLEAMERTNGVAHPDGFEDSRYDPAIVLTAEDCANLWRQRVDHEGRPRFTLPKPVRRFAATEYDPLDE